MTFSTEQVAALKAPLDRKVVKQRAQAGRQLSYIESWQAISEANRIFGFDGWNSNTRLTKLFEPYKDAKDKWRVGYMAKVTVAVKDGAEYVVREGVGYGSGIDNDIGQAHESAIKEAESDARKRALMTFGNPFGLALYDKEQANVTDGEPANEVSAPAAVGTRRLSKPDARPEYEKLIKEFTAIQDPATLAQWGALNKARLDAMPEDWQITLKHEYSEHKSSLMKRAAA